MAGGRIMNDDQRELMKGIKQRMIWKGGVSSLNFHRVLKEDPFLLTDLLCTFGDTSIKRTELIADDPIRNIMHVMIYRRGKKKPYLSVLHLGIGDEEKTYE
jgi:hypothetical protein